MLKLPVPVGGVNLRQLNDELSVAGYFYSCLYSNRYRSNNRATFVRGAPYVGVKGDIPESEIPAITLIVANHVAQPEPDPGLEGRLRRVRMREIVAVADLSTADISELVRLVAEEIL